MQTQSSVLYKVKNPKIPKKFPQKCDTYLKMYKKTTTAIT